MSADFWAGYVSGAAGIIIGNPLDIVKVNLQRPSPESLATTTTTTTTTTVRPPSPSPPQSPPSRFHDLGALLKGTAAPILGYGALNALLFMTYNRSMYLFAQDPSNPSSLGKTWMSGALAGLATFVVSAPTEVIKCRAQVSRERLSSLDITTQLWRHAGIRGLYLGGAVTSLRDSIGYGFYFWSYELSKRALAGSERGSKPEWMSVMLCGGIAGVVTWASVFPLDVVKTRLQTQDLTQRPPHLAPNEQSSLVHPPRGPRLTAVQIAQQAYRNEGLAVFFRGLGVCSFRAFFVNAVQWAVYEWMMHVLLKPMAEETKVARLA